MTMPNAQSAVSRAFDSPDIRQAVADLRLRLADGSRLLLGVAGAPGAGKSTFSASLADFFGPGAALVVPMDGFHLGNAVIDGTPLRQRKGAPDTFDVDGYVSALQRLHHEPERTLFVPGFERDLEQPIAAAIALPPTARFVVTEGNYLLLDDPAWTPVTELIDEAWFCALDDTSRRERLIDRHVTAGRDRGYATTWVDRSDESNARLVGPTAVAANVVLVDGEIVTTTDPSPT